MKPQAIDKTLIVRKTKKEMGDVGDTPFGRGLIDVINHLRAEEDAVGKFMKEATFEVITSNAAGRHRSWNFTIVTRLIDDHGEVN